MTTKIKLKSLSFVLAMLLTLPTVTSVSTAQENAYPLQMSSNRISHRPEVPGPNGLVTAGHPLASMAGLQMLMRGGNAIDASVATLAVLNVVRPQMSGAGGNGFLTYFDSESGSVHSLSATGAAPKALRADQLDSEELNKGIKAGAVPGLFGGWISMLQRYGSMSLQDVIGPAIEYARNGHPIEDSVVRSITSSQKVFEQFPSSRDMFLPNGEPPKTGEIVRYLNLANTFERLVEAEQQAISHGANRQEGLQAAFDLFYVGDIASEMAAFYESAGGEFTVDDFASYEPMWRDPIHVNYRGYDIYTSPPSSRGGLEVLMQLKLVEGFNLAAMGPQDPQLTHLLAEAIKVAKADIYHYVADATLYDMPIEGMLSDDYARSRRQLISSTSAMAFPGPGQPPGYAESSAYLANQEFAKLDSALVAHLDERSVDGSTTSFSIRDRFGNVVAATPTHGGSFGTGVVVGNTGLTFNNGTRVGSTSPYPEDINYAQGGQIPILNNSPIIVLKDGEFIMALGTPGGETIGQTQFQVLVNVLDHGMSVQEAIEAPRFSVFAEPNFYLEGAEITVRIEDRISIEHFDGLKALNHQIRLAPSFSLGSIQAILRNEELDSITAGADPRRAAYAVGW